MDKYQEKILSKSTTLSLSSTLGDGSCSFTNNVLEFNQNENYEITKYVFKIANNAIDKIVFDNKTVKAQDGILSFEIDFNSKISKIAIYFVNEIADSLQLDVVYNFSDKNAFDAKIEKETAQKNKEAMTFFTSEGLGLISAYWKKATESVTSVVVKIERNACGQFYLVEESVLDSSKECKTFTNLAYGEYIISIVQKSAKGKTIAADSKSVIVSDLKKFFSDLGGKLDEVKGQVRASGKNVVTFGR